jgi:BlaI family penicillinase repressor
MTKSKSQQLTSAEQRIMDELWDIGEASVKKLTERLEPKHDLAYTTILTTIRIMADKGFVDFRKEGRAHIFFPLLSREVVQSSALGQLVQSLFGGSPRKLALHLIEDEKLTLEEIDEIRAALISKSHTEGGEK